MTNRIKKHSPSSAEEVPPGINSVISSVTIEAKKSGWEVYGIYDGFSNLGKGRRR